MPTLRPCVWFRIACFNCGNGTDIAVATGGLVEEHSSSCPQCKSHEVEVQYRHNGQTTRALPATMPPIQFHYAFSSGQYKSGTRSKSHQRGGQRGGRPVKQEPQHGGKQ